MYNALFTAQQHIHCDCISLCRHVAMFVNCWQSSLANCEYVMVYTAVCISIYIYIYIYIWMCMHDNMLCYRTLLRLATAFRISSLATLVLTASLTTESCSRFSTRPSQRVSNSCLFKFYYYKLTIIAINLLLFILLLILYLPSVLNQFRVWVSSSVWR